MQLGHRETRVLTVSFGLSCDVLLPVFRGRLGYLLSASTRRRFEFDSHPRVQGAGNSAQHAKGMAFVARRLKPADLLLRGLEKLGEVLLREPGTLA